ncbi:cation transporter [Ilumatobacter sp.]|uniref:cation transporter n=1 Tax=Ilumatobacter sp. TaxID=1967498 RepID=UPI0037502668
MSIELETSKSAGRHEIVRRATVLNRLTIGWNVIEGIVAITAGVAASSVGLIAFGLDSGIEVSAALVLAWRLRQEQRDGCQLGADDRARRLVAWSFAALATYVSISATIDLVGRHEPEASTVGIAIATLSLAVMPVLATAKRKQALALGSQAAVAEAAQTNVCTMLSAALLVGLVANAALGWWWADPVAGLTIAGVAAWMAVRTFRADSLEHTCC